MIKYKKQGMLVGIIILMLLLAGCGKQEKPIESVVVVTGTGSQAVSPIPETVCPETPTPVPTAAETDESALAEDDAEYIGEVEEVIIPEIDVEQWEAENPEIADDLAGGDDWGPDALDIPVPTNTLIPTPTKVPTDAPTEAPTAVPTEAGAVSEVPPTFGVSGEQTDIPAEPSAVPEVTEPAVTPEGSGETAGTGTDGTGNDGTGTDGTGTEGSGADGTGTDGTGEHTESSGTTEPDTEAGEVTPEPSAVPDAGTETEPQLTPELSPSAAPTAAPSPIPTKVPGKDVTAEFNRKLIAECLAKLGCEYKTGGGHRRSLMTSGKYFDCTGFITYSLESLGFPCPGLMISPAYTWDTWGVTNDWIHFFERYQNGKKLTFTLADGNTVTYILYRPTGGISEFKKADIQKYLSVPGTIMLKASPGAIQGHMAISLGIFPWQDSKTATEAYVRSTLTSRYRADVSNALFTKNTYCKSSDLAKLLAAGGKLNAYQHEAVWDFRLRTDLKEVSNSYCSLWQVDCLNKTTGVTVNNNPFSRELNGITMAVLVPAK